ncbi:hypothetical protein [uncultured Thiodictyon sp.]|uniref:hypothetical protein n=1 Tax=uncultured Thiodictyon sp. TaxID=1846217 RepID=UPI0025FDD85A|nr:hypothetical protein [uncultured Thiodictyon sp.]
MGRFTEDMGRLRDEIESDRIARQTLIADTRQEVTEAAQAFISDLKNSVETLQADFREAHADMAEGARADRNAFLARLGSAVADIRISAANRQASVREALAQSAAEARTERAQSTAVLRDEVADLQDGFRRAHSVMAVEVRAAGQAFVSDIVGAVADIQRQTVALVNDYAGERSAGRQAWRGAPAAKPALAPTPVRAKAPVEPEPAKPAPKARHKAEAKAEAPVKAAEKPTEKPTEEVRPVTPTTGDESTPH